MRKIQNVEVKSVSYIHDPHATQKWCSAFLDVLLDAKRKEKELN
ncbi:hypothetical protein [Guptibacillus hwajinpoensis]|nr:hypothetical protein [Pseudalkalibacillus hwajinpoensis]WLR60633.1 hypothetical protein LC071_04560 [Pseudalkalibacillus hwajinpoensis]